MLISQTQPVTNRQVPIQKCIYKMLNRKDKYNLTGTKPLLSYCHAGAFDRRNL